VNGVNRTAGIAGGGGAWSSWVVGSGMIVGKRLQGERGSATERGKNECQKYL